MAKCHQQTENDSKKLLTAAELSSRSDQERSFTQEKRYAGYVATKTKLIELGMTL